MLDCQSSCGFAQRCNSTAQNRIHSEQSDCMNILGCPGPGAFRLLAEGEDTWYCDPQLSSTHRHTRGWPLFSFFFSITKICS